MAFRVVNPAWKEVSLKRAEKHAPAVLTWMQANSGSRYVTLAELRAALPEAAAELTREVVNQIAVIIGAQVDGADGADV